MDGARLTETQGATSHDALGAMDDQARHLHGGLGWHRIEITRKKPEGGREQFVAWHNLRMQDAQHQAFELRRVGIIARVYRQRGGKHPEENGEDCDLCRMQMLERKRRQEQRKKARRRARQAVEGNETK